MRSLQTLIGDHTLEELESKRSSGKTRCIICLNFVSCKGIMQNEWESSFEAANTRSGMAIHPQKANRATEVYNRIRGVRLVHNWECKLHSHVL